MIMMGSLMWPELAKNLALSCSAGHGSAASIVRIAAMIERDVCPHMHGNADDVLL
jgi:hypothetical protein